jgi:hypothetical protein
MVNFNRLVCPTINKANNETWVRQPESPVGLRIHILLAVPLLGGVAVGLRTHLPVGMARHLHGTLRHERQIHTLPMAAKPPHGMPHHGRQIPTLVVMVVKLRRGMRPPGHRIHIVSRRGDQAAGAVVHRLHVQRTQAGRLG